MRRRPVPVLAVLSAAAVAVAGIALFAYSRLAERRPGVPDAKPAAALTTPIRRMDLETSTTVSGTIGHGPPTPFTGRKAGTLTWLPATGTVVGRGRRLYEVDARPVPLLIGRTPLYRRMRAGVTPGPDVRELIENLRAMGYAGAGTGDTFGRATAAALKRWQRAAGLKATGTLGIGDAAVLPGAVRIDSLKAQPGAPAATELFAYTSVRKVVTVELDPEQPGDTTLRSGMKVTVLLPGGRRTGGRVTKVSAPAASGADSGVGSGPGGGGAPKRNATVTVTRQAALAGVDGPVDIEVTAEGRRGVLAVPVTALLALAEGGYALQVVHGGTTTLAGVRTGVFANGMVEVSGAGLAEGLRVVVAS